MCTYADCLTPNELYSGRAEWLSHEEETHRVAWRCREHPNDLFNSQGKFEHHLNLDHHGLSSISIEASCKFSRIFLPDERDQCRICLVAVSALPQHQSLANHMAYHFEAFALLSLPGDVWSDDEDEEDDIDNDDDHDHDDNGVKVAEVAQDVAVYDTAY